MRMQEQSFLDDSKTPKLEDIFTKVAIMHHHNKRLAVLKKISRFFFFEQVHTVKQYEASLLRHQKEVKTSVSH